MGGTIWPTLDFFCSLRKESFHICASEVKQEEGLFFFFCFLLALDFLFCLLQASFCLSALMNGDAEITGLLKQIKPLLFASYTQQDISFRL